jgi:ATP-dependent DNA helicase RecQ
MTATGFLHHDIAGYGGLSLTAKGEALLRGEEIFFYRPEPERPARRSRGDTSAPITGEQSTLLAALKKTRLALAAQRKVPAYLIFSDRALTDMAQRRPRTKEDFAQVNGVGAAKLKDFADIFLAAIAAHTSPSP